jgi:hypothetical protein
MDRKAVVAALAPAFILYACDRAVTPAEEPLEKDVEASESAAATSYLPPTDGDVAAAGPDQAAEAAAPEDTPR